MTIETSNENQRAFRDSEMDERVVWDDFQMADLDDGLEEYLVETYDSIVYVDEGDRPEDDAASAAESEGEDEDENEDAFTVESRAAEAVGNLESEDDDGDSDGDTEEIAEAVDVEDETDE